MTNKNILPKREYNDGDIVKFDFEPNSLDIHWHKVSIIGVVSGILYENDGICYKVQLRDNERCIFGDMIVPEEKINGTITDSVVTVKCDFCDLRTYVDQDNADDIERKTKGWGKFYCLGKKCHVLNMCNRCMEILENVDTKKCPYDSCGIVSKKQKEYLEKQGISLVDKL
jgi:ribosomal protein L21E